jgi:hypothetical protein
MKIAPENRFTANDIQVIQKYLLDTLNNFEKRVKRNEVFDAICDKVSKMERIEFCEALSKSIKDKKVVGFEIIRGPYGGVRLIDPASAKLSSSGEMNESAPAKDEIIDEAKAELQKMKDEKAKKVIAASPLAPLSKSSPSTSSPAPKAEDKPYLQNRPLTTLSSFRWLWINDSRYYIQMTIPTIERFLINVMKATIDLEGTIVFNGKKYIGDEQLLHRFLTEFTGAKVDVSPPLLETTDINGVPIHFISEVNKSPTPQAMEEWNKKQLNKTSVDKVYP